MFANQSDNSQALCINSAGLAMEHRGRHSSQPNDCLATSSEAGYSFPITHSCRRCLGNVTQSIEGHAIQLNIQKDGQILVCQQMNVPAKGWSNVNHNAPSLPNPGEYEIAAELKNADGATVLSTVRPLTVNDCLSIPRVLSAISMSIPMTPWGQKIRPTTSHMAVTLPD